MATTDYSDILDEMRRARIDRAITRCAEELEIDLTADLDEMHIEAAAIQAEISQHPIYDTYAVALNLDMDDDAQRRYREIWGVEWVDLPAVAGDEDRPLRRSPRFAVGTDAGASTIPASGHGRRSRS